MNDTLFELLRSVDTPTVCNATARQEMKQMREIVNSPQLVILNISIKTG